MKIVSKRSRWAYIGLILMLFALVCFSLAPLVGSVLQARNAKSGQSVLSVSNQLDSQVLGYQMVLEREPENQTALQGLLEARLKQGDIKAAIEPLERLALLNPQQSEYTFLLAQAKERVEDFEGASAAYRAILAAYPGQMMALKGLVDLLSAQNRFSDAVGEVQAALSKAISLQSDEAETPSNVDLTALQLLLGEIYVKQKKYPEALAVYQEASKFDPKDFRPVLAQAFVLKEQGKTTESQPLFEQAVTLAPVQYKDQVKEIAAQNSETIVSPPEDKTPTSTEQ
ncbi:tetratricopeptide repeat protein [Gloeothece verrucosa]|uniref:Tetratricopeptide TPR_2 repeat protein n=1 Tax=Gloeothece verrucosa (strain PCC 7822) TaxID=497965 RepID=E0UJM1_GLOV7|nr:tetratricopeptide repeat protein [Gloeothece verrucosa]ADN12265.1 Tetratricopeptide TPR_2 repeat protein [Gloeothece verrucosa PCC 7822]